MLSQLLLTLALLKAPVGPTTAVFFDIATVDLERAKTFYTALLGWEFQAGTTPGYQFALVFDHGKLIGDLDVVPAAGKPGGVSMYFPVADLKASFAKAKALGAQVLFEPMNVPSDTVAGAIAMVQDPDGNPIGLYSPDPIN